MSTTRKVAVGLGVAGGALIAAWLLTGDRKRKTKEFVAKKANDIKNALARKEDVEEQDVHYI
jgi:hypothetical protein